MRLGGRILDNVSNVNSFRYVDRIDVTAGDAFDFYFQLTDLAARPNPPGTAPDGLRYVPVAGATAVVVTQNLNDAMQITRAASQPFSADDRSIWKVTFLDSDPIHGTVDMKVILTESGVSRAFIIRNAIGAQGIGDVC